MTLFTVTYGIGGLTQEITADYINCEDSEYRFMDAQDRLVTLARKSSVRSIDVTRTHGLPPNVLEEIGLLAEIVAKATKKAQEISDLIELPDK